MRSIDSLWEEDEYVYLSTNEKYFICHVTFEGKTYIVHYDTISDVYRHFYNGNLLITWFNDSDRVFSGYGVFCCVKNGNLTFKLTAHKRKLESINFKKGTLKCIQKSQFDIIKVSIEEGSTYYIHELRKNWVPNQQMTRPKPTFLDALYSKPYDWYDRIFKIFELKLEDMIYELPLNRC